MGPSRFDLWTEERLVGVVCRPCNNKLAHMKKGEQAKQFRAKGTPGLDGFDLSGHLLRCARSSGSSDCSRARLQKNSEGLLGSVLAANGTHMDVLKEDARSLALSCSLWHLPSSWMPRHDCVVCSACLRRVHECNACGAWYPHGGSGGLKQHKCTEKASTSPSSASPSRSSTSSQSATGIRKGGVHKPIPRIPVTPIAKPSRSSPPLPSQTSSSPRGACIGAVTAAVVSKDKMRCQARPVHSSAWCDNSGIGSPDNNQEPRRDVKAEPQSGSWMTVVPVQTAPGQCKPQHTAPVLCQQPHTGVQGFPLAPLAFAVRPVPSLVVSQGAWSGNPYGFHHTPYYYSN